MQKMLLIVSLSLLWIPGSQMSKNLNIGDEPSFLTIPLGHNSLLIKWSLPANKVKGFTHYVFAITRNSGSATEIYRTSSINGHISSHILALKTNTRYKINVEVSGTNFNEPYRTVLEAKTNEIQKRAPAKPDFEYRIFTEKYSYPELKVTWLPCGQQDDCGSGFAGAYFYVKYEEKGSSDSVIVEEFVNDYVYINDCCPGYTYQFIVVSVYGDYETESDPQEISFPKASLNFETMHALMKEDVTIPCKLPLSSTDQLTWNWTSSFLNTSKVSLLSNGDLYIRALEVFDGGKFTCFERNSPSFKITFLHVKAKSQITNNQEFGNAVVKAGEDFQMQCNFWHDQSLSAKVWWLKNGGSDLDSNSQILGYKQNIIVISHARKENSGDYTCVVTSPLDSTNATFTLNVI